MRFANPSGELAGQYDWLVPHLNHLQSVYKLMLSQREKRGAIEFESTETMMLFNEDGKIDQIVPVTRNEAHRLIEECMLAANVCAADFLSSQEHPALYRIHETPTVENWNYYARLWANLALAWVAVTRHTQKIMANY